MVTLVDVVVVVACKLFGLPLDGASVAWTLHLSAGNSVIRIRIRIW